MSISNNDHVAITQLYDNCLIDLWRPESQREEALDDQNGVKKQREIITGGPKTTLSYSSSWLWRYLSYHYYQDNV